MSLKDNMGNWITLESEVARLVRNGFLDLFSTNRISAHRSIWAINGWSACLSEEDREVLSLPISTLEIHEATWSLKPFKAPGPDGIHARFYQRQWAVVGSTVTKEVQSIFTNRQMPDFLNQTLITLIPKCTGADCLNKFRPISLCNTVYKVVTKVIVQRLRPYLSKLISPLQTAFVPRRKGLDNMIIVQELLHTLSTKKGKVGFLALKIDLEKPMTSLNGISFGIF